MAENTNTITSLTNEQQTFYDKTLLSRLLPNLVWTKYGQKKSVPKNGGNKVNFRRFNSLPAVTTALTEGITPSGESLDITKVEVPLNQYGDFVRITDQLDMMGIDPVLTETSALSGEQAALSIDTSVRDVVVKGTSVQYAGGKENADAITATDVITAKEIKKAVRTLRKNNAKPAEAGFYIGIVDPDTAYDIMEDPLWQDISKYSGGVQIMKGEIGKLGGVRFVQTTNTSIADNSTDVPVHSTMIIGADAYGVVDLEGSSKPKIIVKPFGSGGTADPLEQRATCGWKVLFATARLQELAMVRIEHAVSA